MAHKPPKPSVPLTRVVLLNNYFGRQFSSVNDVGIHPRNKDVYFTDVPYGYLQAFRPAPGLRNQVYRLNDVTGAVTVVADGFTSPNGKALLISRGRKRCRERTSLVYVDGS